MDMRSEEPRIHYYLVGRPFFRTPSVVGRGTRVFVALDCETRGFVCLKDTWRANHAGIELEGDIFLKLNEKGVSNIPTLVSHGDVSDSQDTMTDEIWEELSDIKSPFRSHTHYRIVVEEVCLPLSKFKNGHELIKVTGDCLLGEVQPLR